MSERSLRDKIKAYLRKRRINTSLPTTVNFRRDDIEKTLVKFKAKKFSYVVKWEDVLTALRKF